MKPLFAFCLLPFFAHAQNYTATNGSSYIGSLNVHNNPAAIVNSPLPWDLTLFGIQDKHTTNAVQILKYSLLSNPANAEYLTRSGQYSRRGDLNFNLNLFNIRIALNKKRAIAFGANLKSYSSGKTSPYNFVDTIGVGEFNNFLLQNIGLQSIHADGASSSWAEVYATYAQTVFDNGYGRLNAGITIKLNSGLSGAFASGNASVTRDETADPVEFRITDALFDFGYSSNYDHWDSNRSFIDNANNFAAFTKAGGSFDIGFEYLVKLQSVPSVFHDEMYFDYDWKIGVALLDIGYGRYRYGKYSTKASDIKTDVTGDLLDDVFDSTITNLAVFRDSLTNVFDNITTPTGKFSISHPARLVVNVDKFITEAFFVNADISVNLSSLSGSTYKKIRDINLLTLTPRWETRKRGYYLPFYYNNRNELWIGGAIRTGPVLFGIHNWSNIFSTKKITRGGAYLALILKPTDFTGNKADKRLNCYW